MSGGNVQPAIDAAEHLSTLNGEGVEAKRVGNYVWGGFTDKWKRQPSLFIDESYDYVEFTNADSNGNYRTITFKSGGAGGTVVRTITLVFDANNNITTVTRS
jgi:hypothetical protein